MLRTLLSSAATLATLVRIIKPWRRVFAIVVASGIGRVAAFIGVGVFSALAVAAVHGAGPLGRMHSERQPNQSPILSRLAGRVRSVLGHELK